MNYADTPRILNCVRNTNKLLWSLKIKDKFRNYSWKATKSNKTNWNSITFCWHWTLYIHFTLRNWLNKTLNMKDLLFPNKLKSFWMLKKMTRIGTQVGWRLISPMPIQISNLWDNQSLEHLVKRQMMEDNNLKVWWVSKTMVLTKPMIKLIFLILKEYSLTCLFHKIWRIISTFLTFWLTELGWLSWSTQKKIKLLLIWIVPFRISTMKNWKEMTPLNQKMFSTKKCSNISLKKTMKLLKALKILCSMGKTPCLEMNSRKKDQQETDL